MPQTQTGFDLATGIERGMARAIRELRQEEHLSPRQWIERNLWIRDKHQRVVRLRFNAIQEVYWRARGARDIILKYRQGGVSTIVAAEFFEDTVRTPHTLTVVVAHDLESTKRLFEIVKRFYDHLPAEEKARLCRQPDRPQYRNRRELYFDRIDSWYVVATAGSKGAGRSQTINNLHCSEVAFWPGDPQEIMTGLLEAVSPTGRVKLESTANGVGGYFHAEYNLAKAGESRFKAHFFPWWIHEEYRLPLEPGEKLEFDEEERALVEKHGLTSAQIKWRKAKQTDLRDKFPQEYPEDDVSCFLLSGRPVFDGPTLLQLLKRCEEPVETRDSGQLKIWVPPQEGRRYDIGADVAEGLIDGDYSAAVVIDHETGEDVAALRGHWPDHVYAKKLDELGRLYNHALLGVEDNNHGHSVINTLVNVLRYPSLYARQDPEKLVAGRERRWGWNTNALSKPILIDGLQELITDGVTIRNAEIVSECLAYEHKADGSMGAQAGCFDDLVMAWGIAHQLRQQGASAKADDLLKL